MTKYYLGKLLTIASIAHFIFPFIMGLILKSKWYYGIFILVVFEIIENIIFRKNPLVIFGMNILSPEPLINVIADLIIGTVGLYLGCIIISLI